MLVRGDAKNYQEPGGNFQYNLDETNQVYKTKRVDGYAIHGQTKPPPLQDIMTKVVEKRKQ